MKAFKLLQGFSQTEQMAAAIFGVVLLYTAWRGTAHTVLAGIAFALMIYGALPKQRALALLVGASVTLLLQRYSGIEGFEDIKKEEKKEETKEEKKEEATEEATEEEEPATKEEFSSAAMLPDNATRREPLQLGKPYKLPSEKDDQGYHLDSGTTFLNAYKALKPDQIAAMTRDTQELLSTQKSLVSMLNSFAPLIQDMKQISNFTNMLN
jgi:hypothetical protein